MADDRDADAEHVTKLETGGKPNPENHPGSRYGTAPEDRPDLSPEVEPAVKADVKPGDVPDSLTGAMPENAGHDPGDVHRDPPQRSARRPPEEERGR